MKILSRYVILLFLFGCTNEKPISFNLTTIAQYEFVEIETVKNELNYYWSGYDYINYKKDSFLIGFDMYRNNLDFISLSKDKSKSFSFNIQREGPNQIKSTILNIRFSSKFMYILTHSHAYFCEVNFSSKDYTVINEMSINEEYQFIPVAVNFSAFPITSNFFEIIGNSIIVPIFPNIPITSPEFFDKFTLGLIDFDTDEIRLIHSKWPKHLKGEEGITFPFALTQYPIYLNDNFIISYPFTEEIYLVKREDWSKSYKWNEDVAGFDRIVNLVSINKSEASMPNVKTIEEFIRKGRFFPLRMNETQNITYRIVKDSYPKNGIETNGFEVMRLTNKWLVEYNLHGRVLGVRQLPIEFDLDPIVIDGKYWFPLVKGNDLESVIKFAVVDPIVNE
jgi:hypothetical protein